MEYSKEMRELFLMQQTYATLSTVTNKLDSHADKYFKGLTSRQYMIILAIFHLPEDETTVKNIANKLSTTKQNVNQLISTIEKKGYVITAPSERDKRAINVKVTESGVQAMLECAEAGVTFMADAFNEFTEEELETLWSLLKKLYRYDGREQDGFEEDANDRLEGDHSEIQTRVLKEFAIRRKGGRSL